jgi:hypothetical protein
MLIEESKYDEIISLLDEHDKYLQFEEFVSTPKDAELVESVKSYLYKDRYRKFAVLGIDIYRYSHYPEIEQFMIPVIFKQLYESAVHNCIREEPFLFQQLNQKELVDSFISTGDGGFQIFPTPLHAFVFALYFEADLRTFNSFSSYPKLRNFIGEISLRYSLTLDKLFHFEQNYFGPGLITNARILSKDHLNRFLIDANSYNWFLKATAGIESLLRTNLQVLSQIDEFKSYDISKPKNNSLIFPVEKGEKSTLRLLNVQKVGLLEAKGTSIDIHSVFVQWDLNLTDESHKKSDKPFVMSLGNTNISGI